MKKLAAFLIAFALSPVALADPSLLGQWKSNAELSMKFNTEHAKLDSKRIAFFEGMFGHLRMTFTAKAVTVSMPDWESTTALGKAPMVGFTETLPYKVLGSNRTEVAVSG